MSSSLSTLAQLAEQSKRLTSHIGGFELPHIERGIDQIENQSRKLASKASKPVEGVDNKAHFFLASGGVNSEGISQVLNTINMKSTFEPLQPLRDTDTEAYLRHQHEQMILSTIDESRRETVQDFDNNFEASLNHDWEKTKKRIFEGLGHQQGEDANKDHGRAGGAATFLPTFGQSPAAFDSMLLKMAPYYNVLQNLCNTRLQKGNAALATDFGFASKEDKNQVNPRIEESWDLLAFVLRERESRNGRDLRQQLAERIYAKAYLRSPVNSPEARELRQHFIVGARTFLERQYMRHIETAVAESKDAGLTGVTAADKIRAYLTLKHVRQGSYHQPNLEIARGVPIWGQIYYLLRTGHAHEALAYANENRSEFAPAEVQFLTYFAAYLESPDRILPEKMQELLLSDFNQRIRYSSESGDPYKLVLYKIIGRCDLAKKTTAVIGALEDFLWLQLVMIRESTPQTIPQDKYDLFDLQTMVLNYGPSYFNPKGNNPLQYFSVLILTQQFERAIHYLSTFKSYLLEAVHMAIALTFCGVLRIPTVHRHSDPTSLTITQGEGGREVAHFNFTQLMQYHARIVAEKYPAEALLYLYQICLNTDLDEATRAEQTALCYGSIQELILQSKSYPTLLGTTTHGVTTPSVMEKYLPLIRIQDRKDFVQKITSQAANRSLAEGRWDDAMQLFSIAEQYGNVIRLLNKQMAESLSNPAGNRGEPLATTFATTKGLIAEYMGNQRISRQIGDKDQETCGTLLKLVEFMENFDQAKYETALGLIAELGLIPLEASQAEITVAVENVNRLDESIARAFPEILLRTMECVGRLHYSLKQSPYDLPGRAGNMAMLKRYSKNIMIFAGQIKAKMPADTYARLNQLSVAIGY